MFYFACSLYSIFALHRNCTFSSFLLCLHVLKFSENVIWISLALVRTFNTLVLSTLALLFFLHFIFSLFSIHGIASLATTFSHSFVSFSCKSKRRFICKLQVFIPWNIKLTKVSHIIIAHPAPPPTFLKVTNCFLLINKESV